MSSDGYISDMEIMVEEGQTDLENLVKTKHKLDEVMHDLYKIGNHMNRKLEIERIKNNERNKYLKQSKEAREKQNEKLEKLRNDHNQEKKYMVESEKERLDLLIKLIIDKYPYMKEAQIRKELRVHDGKCHGKSKNGKPCPNKGINDSSLDPRQRGFCKSCRPSIECKSEINNKLRREIADIFNGDEVEPYTMNATSDELRAIQAVRNENHKMSSSHLSGLFDHLKP